jgi:hypothetical protein
LNEAFKKNGTKLMAIIIMEYHSHQAYAELQHFCGKTVSTHRRKIFGDISVCSGAMDELLSRYQLV